MKHVSNNKKRWFIPIIALIVVISFVTTLIYPVMVMEPRDIPLAILSLDEGGDTPSGHVNIGESLTAQIIKESTSANDSDENIISWTEYKDRDKLEKAMDDNRYYAALIIPADFTKTKTASLSGLNMMKQGIENLAKGIVGINEGSTTLQEKSSDLPNQSQKLAYGTTKLRNGLEVLYSKLGDSEKMGSAVYGAANLNNGISTMSSNINDKLSPGAKTLSDSVPRLEQLNDRTDMAIQQAITALTESQPDVQAAIQALQTAQGLSSATGNGLAQLNVGSETLYNKIGTISQQLPKLEDGSSQLLSGLKQMSSSVENAKNNSYLLEQGGMAFMNNSPMLVDGIGRIQVGSAKLNSGITTLSDKVKTIAENNSGVSEGDLQLILNQGMNPMITGNLESNITKMTAATGITLDVNYINPIPEDMGSGTLQMVIFLITLIVSMMMSVIMYKILPLDRIDRKSRAYGLVKITLYSMIMAILIGFSVASVVTLIGGMNIPFTVIAIFISISSFSILVFASGCLEWMGLRGILLPMLLIILGVGVSVLPYESLPSFWQKWVYGWMPLRFITDGLKEILYMGQGFNNGNSWGLICFSIIGILILASSLLKKDRHKTSPS